MATWPKVILIIAAFIPLGCIPRTGPSSATHSAERSTAAPALIGIWDVTRPERSQQVYEIKQGGAYVLKTEGENGAWNTSRGTWEITGTGKTSYEVHFRDAVRDEMLTIVIRDNDTMITSDWKGRDIVFKRRK
jgi:uncharacterized protein (TIGR03066 family)